MNRTSTCIATCLWAVLALVATAADQTATPTKVEKATFDADPHWEGFRNRLLPSPLPVTLQDFGYRATHHAGGENAGEIGGTVERSTGPAYYGKRIEPRTLDDPLHASGKLAVPFADSSSGVMIGWYNAESSRGWRTPNSLAMRLDGNSTKYWVFYEYGTRNYRTGGGGAFAGEHYQTTPTPPFKVGNTIHTWSLDYDPAGAEGKGLLKFRIDDRKYQVALPPEHRADGATFNRFGIWNVQTPGERLELYLDDLAIDGERETFDEDPAWEAVDNHVEYAERVIRPYHDFGFSKTNYCGRAAGEIGGIVFRDERPAFYGKAVGKLSLDDELRASGKIALRKAGSDSGVYFGWFNSQDKRHNEKPEYEARQRDYMAIMVEGPSRVGHFFRPSYSTSSGAGGTASGEGRDGRLVWPVIRPDGGIHDWSLHYRPEGARGRGAIEVSLDGESHTMELPAGHREIGATFDRFGIFDIQAGGHHVEIYLDDVSFTRR